MFIIKKILCLSVALAFLCAALCSCNIGRKEKFTEYSFDYFDTVTTFIGYEYKKSDFDAVYAKVKELLSEYHRLYNIYFTYEGMNNLRALNSLKDGEHPTLKVDKRIIDLLKYAKEMYAYTDGYVNIAMGSVLSIWHEYRQEGIDNPAQAKLPPADKLMSAAEHTDINDIVIDEENGTVTLSDPLMSLDVGAIAKGYAVECTAKALEDMGLDGYLLNVGGNIRAIGDRGEDGDWKAGIENPLSDGDKYIAYLNISGMSVVTSGSYQRYYTVGGKRYHHIIDRDTLMPGDRYVAVSVVTRESSLGDALSTAIFCMPFDKGLALIESTPDTECIWTFSDGTHKRSSGFDKYTYEP